MRIAGIEVKRRAWISVLFALAATMLWWLWTSAKIPVVASKPIIKPPAIRIARPETGSTDSLLRERAEYFDTTPLFFPTERNFGQGELHESMKRQPGQIFGFIEPKFFFGDQNIKSYNSAELPAASRRLADIVSSGNEAVFAGIGEKDDRPAVLPARDGFVEVRNLRDGKIIIAQAVAEIPGLQADFVPLEYLVAVSRSGLVGDPVLMTGAGREDLEVFLRTYLAKSFRVGERLDPGMYRILIGP